MGATDVVEVKLIVTGACRLVRGAAREDWDTILFFEDLFISIESWEVSVF